MRAGEIVDGLILPLLHFRGIVANNSYIQFSAVRVMIGLCTNANA